METFKVHLFLFFINKKSNFFGVTTQIFFGGITIHFFFRRIQNIMETFDQWNHLNYMAFITEPTTPDDLHVLLDY
jgi:hypothetical protein